LRSALLVPPFFPDFVPSGLASPSLSFFVGFASKFPLDWLLFSFRTFLGRASPSHFSFSPRVDRLHWGLLPETFRCPPSCFFPPRIFSPIFSLSRAGSIRSLPFFSSVVPLSAFGPSRVLVKRFFVLRWVLRVSVASRCLGVFSQAMTLFTVRFLAHGVTFSRITGSAIHASVTLSFVSPRKYGQFWVLRPVESPVFCCAPSVFRPFLFPLPDQPPLQLHRTIPLQRLMNSLAPSVWIGSHECFPLRLGLMAGFPGPFVRRTPSRRVGDCLFEVS